MSEGFIERNKKAITDHARAAATDFLSQEEARLKAELTKIKETWLKKKEEDISWFKEAFYYQYNLIMLGGLVALAAVSGPAMPLFASLAVAWEALWLGMAPGNERFRRAVRAVKNEALLEEQEDKRKDRLKNLPLPLQMRHEEAVEIAKEIRAQAEQAEEGELEILDETIAKLDYLLDQYADMLVSLHQTGQLLKDPEAEELPGQVEALKIEIEDMNPGKVRQAKEKNLAILSQRLTSFKKSREEKEFVEVSLNTLENTLKLVRDRVIAASTAGAINSSLDDVVLELSQHREHMEAVESEMVAAAETRPNEDREATLSAPEAAPFAGTSVDPNVERDISAPPEAPSEDEQPPGLLEEFARE